MILVGVGSNVAAAGFNTPLETIWAALSIFPDYGINIDGYSAWYETAPVPSSSQPWFVNGVLQVGTDHEPDITLQMLHKIEARFGRQRVKRNEARTLDLDLLDFNGLVTKYGNTVILPHPRIGERAFVLLPLRDVCPTWISPSTGCGIKDLIAQLPREQLIRKIPSS